MGQRCTLFSMFYIFKELQNSPTSSLLLLTWSLVVHIHQKQMPFFFCCNSRQCFLADTVLTLPRNHNKFMCIALPFWYSSGADRFQFWPVCVLPPAVAAARLCSVTAPAIRSPPQQMCRAFTFAGCRSTLWQSSTKTITQAGSRVKEQNKASRSFSK